SIRHIRPILTVEMASTLARCLVLSCLDYCNSLLHGTPAYLISSHQFIQNRLAKLVLELHRLSSSSSSLAHLH
ncbi:hypothetical protein HELRODRAFT_145270, partial [Helobdella robusta]|uniref:Uncharacterized protein n=1 Tax=Helobdella robusta TaxID=6412 RepID=T1EJJ8_HELRO